MHRVVGLIGAGGEFDRFRQLLHGVGEMVAVQAGSGNHDVDTRAFHAFTRHQLDVDDAPAGIPHRFDAQRRQYLRFEHALMAHGFDRPQREGELFGRLAGFRRVRGDQLLGGVLAGFPGLLGRHARGVEAVQVAARGQRVRVLHRVAAVGGRAVLAGQRREQAVHLARRAEVDVPLFALFELGLEFVIDVHRRTGEVVAQELEGRCVADFFVIADEGFVEVFTGHAGGLGGSFPVGFTEHQEHRAEAEFFRRRRAERVQAERLRGLRQFVQVVVQFRHETAYVGGDALVVPAHVLVDAFLPHLLHQIGGDFLAHGTFVLAHPGMQQVVDFV